jgi:putative FmdB family regulatory protein
MKECKERMKMPIYEYECDKCGKTVEAWQKTSDKSLQECQNCSGQLRKIISQSSFQLKGTGWYVTDYKKKTKPKVSQTERKIV